MNYSICSLDRGGHTQRTQTAPYDDDAAALAQARRKVADSAIVEVWKENLLLARLYRDPAEGVVTS